MTQTKYEFQDSLYYSQWIMLEAIAEYWINGNGILNADDVDDMFANETDREIAWDCIVAWNLDNAAEGELSHMEFNKYTRNDLANAFAEMRKEWQNSKERTQ